MTKKQVTTSFYRLYATNGPWLGDIVLTSDGSFMSITDWGNFAFKWSSWGDCDFKTFLLELNIDYFARKMVQGMSYVERSGSVDDAAWRFASRILPDLQEALREEWEGADVAAAKKNGPGPNKRQDLLVKGAWVEDCQDDKKNEINGRFDIVIQRYWDVADE